MKTDARHIVLGVTGSIAAYKSAELVRRMKERQWEVSVLMTREATEFVGEMTFRTLSGNPVGIEMFGDLAAWRPAHIAYAQRADVFVLAPCTAHMMAKIAVGLADDLLCCTALATRAPVVIVPAMNVNMWEHPATQANWRTLKSRGVVFVGPATGELACGVHGKGRMAEVDAILNIVEKLLKQGKRKARNRP